MKTSAAKEPHVGAAQAARRAGRSALGLGLLCLAWLPFWALRNDTGAAQAIFNTFFTLVFVVASLFMLAGRELLEGQASTQLRQATLWLAPLLLALYLRRYLDDLPAWGHPLLSGIGTGLIYAVPLLAGLVLLQLARCNWETRPAA